MRDPGGWSETRGWNRSAIGLGSYCKSLGLGRVRKCLETGRACHQPLGLALILASTLFLASSGPALAGEEAPHQGGSAGETVEPEAGGTSDGENSSGESEGSEGEVGSSDVAETEGESAATEQEAEAGRLALIRERGRLIVGVKSDYPPWGFVDSDGEIVGMEPDLAADLARQLEVELELVGVSSASRFQKLEDGAVDLLIATVGATAERAEIVGLVQPYYYGSGVNVLAPRRARLRSWSQLRGSRVCLTEGAFYNRGLIERYGIEPQRYKGNRDAMTALASGHCVAWAYDSTAILRELQSGEWQGYEMPLPTVDENPWAIVVAKEELDTAFGRFVSDAVAGWLKEGHLTAHEAAWGLASSAYLQKLETFWQYRRSDGRHFCERGEDGRYPDRCLEAAPTRGAPPVALRGLPAILVDGMGIDFSPVYDRFDRRLLWLGIRTTLQLSIVAILGSLLVGLVLGLFSYRSPAILKRSTGLVTSVFRLTPPILHLYILFFGMGSLLIRHFDWTPGAFATASLAFSFYAGSANAVLLASSLESLGAERPGVSLFRLLPAAIDHAYEGLVGNAVNIVKAAGLASTIAVPEIISATRSIAVDRGNTMVMMNFLLVFYVALIWVSLELLQRSRKWMKRS